MIAGPPIRLLTFTRGLFATRRGSISEMYSCAWFSICLPFSESANAEFE